MSTSYYRLKRPIVKLDMESSGSQDKITIWTRHGNAGTLVLNRDETELIALMFAEYENDCDCPMRTHWGGKDIGSVVSENYHIPDEQVLISEYGDILTAKEIRARNGAKRKDGMPTELFGYEEEE